MLEDIRVLRNREPFEPFTIVTSSGDKYLVESPDNVAMMEGRIFYAYPHSRKWVFIRVNQITALETQEHAA